MATTMKNLVKYIEEKLLVNKDAKLVDAIPEANDQFYKEFKERIQMFSTKNLWWMTEHPGLLKSLKVDDKYHKKIDDIFNERYKGTFRRYDKTYYHIVSESTARDVYNDMMDYIYENESDMTFVLHKDLGYGLYLIRIFETTNAIIGVIGPNAIRNYNMRDENAHIFFKYR